MMLPDKPVRVEMKHADPTPTLNGVADFIPASSACYLPFSARERPLLSVPPTSLFELNDPRLVTSESPGVILHTDGSPCYNSISWGIMNAARRASEAAGTRAELGQRRRLALLLWRQV